MNDCVEFTERFITDLECICTNDSVSFRCSRSVPMYQILRVSENEFVFVSVVIIFVCLILTRDSWPVHFK